jgi:Protein of unknown function (DUF5672)
MSITLIIADTEQHALANVAIRQCLRSNIFKDVIAFTDKPDFFPGIRSISIPKIANISNYNALILKRLANEISTDHVLICQYDGFTLNPDLFDSDFLNYDYIGAPWPQIGEDDVGNGGYSLRSTKLLELTAAAAASDPDSDFMSEDLYICKKIRCSLIDKGIKFAPRQVASKFSFEFPAPNYKTYGFHGLFNLPFVYAKNLEYLIENLPARNLEKKIRFLKPGLSVLEPSLISKLESLNNYSE